MNIAATGVGVYLLIAAAAAATYALRLGGLLLAPFTATGTRLPAGTAAARRT